MQMRMRNGRTNGFRLRRSGKKLHADRMRAFGHGAILGIRLYVIMASADRGEPPRSQFFKTERARLESRTWLVMFGNGAPTASTTSTIPTPPKQILSGLGQVESFEAQAGTMKSPNS